MAKAAREELEDAGEGEESERGRAGRAPGSHADEGRTEIQENARPDEMGGGTEGLGEAGDGFDFGGIREHGKFGGKPGEARFGPEFRQAPEGRRKKRLISKRKGRFSRSEHELCKNPDRQVIR